MPPLVLTLQVDDQGSPIIKSFTQSIRGAGTHVTGFGQTAQTSSAHIERLGVSLASAAKLALGSVAAFAGFQGAASVVQSAGSSILSFNKELANVNTLLIGSDVSIRGLEQQILALPPALGSATELTRGLYEALSAGIPPGQAVQFVGASAKIASAGLTDLKSTIRLVTNVMDQFGLSANETARIGDILFTVVNKGKTEFAPLAGAIGDVFPLAKNLGISFEETAATFATLTKVFPTAGQAATGFTGILQGLIQNTDAFRAAGINVRAVIAEEGLTGVLRRLGEVTGESSEVIKARFITEIQGTNAALSIMGPLLNEQRQNITAIGEAAGTSGEAFNRQQAAIEKTLERIGIAFERVILGGGLTPLFQAMLQPIEQWVVSLTQGGEASVQFASTTTGVLEQVVGALDFLVSGLTFVVEGWQRLGEVAGVIIDLELRGLNAIANISASLGLISQDTARQTTAFYTELRTAVLDFSEGQGQAADRTRAFRETVTGGFAKIREAITGAGAQAAAFASTLGGVGSAGAQAAEQVQTGMQQAATATQGVAGAVQQVNMAVQTSTAQTVTGTVTFWREGQFQVREILQRTGTVGSASAKDIGEAFSKAGISTRDALQQIATDALSRFSVILNSGRAAPRDILEEWRKTAKLINEAGFQTLPPSAQEAFTRVAALAKKAGIDLGTIFTDTFGQIRLGSKQLGETVGNEFSIVFGKVLTAEIALGGARGVASLDEATRKMALQLGLVSQTAIETGAALKEGIGEGAKEGVEQALPALQKLDTGLEKTRQTTTETKEVVLSFFTPFPATIQGLQKEITEASLTLSGLRSTLASQLLPQGPDAFDFISRQIEDRLEILQKKLKEAQIAEFDLNKRFDETVGLLQQTSQGFEGLQDRTSDATKAQKDLTAGLADTNQQLERQRILIATPLAPPSAAPTPEELRLMGFATGGEPAPSRFIEPVLPQTPGLPALPPVLPAMPVVPLPGIGTTRTVQVTNNITVTAAQLTRQSGQDLLDQLLPALRQTIQRGLLAF